MKKRFTKCLPAILLFLIIWPCQGKEEVIQSHFRVGIDSQLTEPIDPHLNRDIRQRILYQAIFATLYRFNSESSPRPLLLKMITVKDQTAEMELHNDLKFSDGRPLTATDVIFSLERLLKCTHPQHTLKQYIEGADAFIKGETPRCAGLVELDAHRFIIRFTNNYSTLTYLLAEPASSILPSDWNPDKAVYSGAYMISPRQANKAQNFVPLEKNPHWRLTHPNMNHVDVYFYKDPSVFYEAISRGEMDLFLCGFGTELPQKNLPYKTVQTPANGQFYIMLNPNVPPFDDPNWRRFFKEIILDLSHRFQLHWPDTTSYRLVMPYGLTGYDLFKPIKPSPIIRPLAPQGELVIPVHFIRSTLRLKLFTFLSEQLAPYHVKLQPIWAPVTISMGHTKPDSFSLTGFYFLSESPVTINFFERMFLPEQDLNPAGFSLPKAIALIGQYHQERNELSRMHILSQLETLAQESSFLIPVLGFSYTLGTKPNRPVIHPNRFFNLFIDQIATKQ